MLSRLMAVYFPSSNYSSLKFRHQIEKATCGCSLEQFIYLFFYNYFLDASHFALLEKRVNLRVLMLF